MRKWLLFILFPTLVWAQDGADEQYDQRDQQQLEQQLDSTMQDLSAYGGPETRLSNTTQTASTPQSSFSPAMLQDIQKLQDASKEGGDNLFDRTMSNMTGMLMKQLLESNPFSRFSRDEVKKVIQEQIPHPAFKEIIADYPVLLEIITDLLRDDEALISLVKITLKRDQLKKYGMFFVGLFIINMILNLFLDKNRSILQKIVRRLATNALIFCINMGYFYFLFKEELTPAIEIVKGHLL
jgi:hypothetical protein